MTEAVLDSTPYVIAVGVGILFFHWLEEKGVF